MNIINTSRDQTVKHVLLPCFVTCGWLWSEFIVEGLCTPMAESSSDSDRFFCRERLSRWAARSTHKGVRGHPAVDVTEKVHSITSTLQVSDPVMAFRRSSVARAGSDRILTSHSCLSLDKHGFAFLWLLWDYVLDTKRMVSGRKDIFCF